MSRRAKGFSLIELLVAFSIMALALGVLYRAMGGSAAQTSVAVEHDAANLLGASLLAAYENIPAEGVQASGESDAFRWSVATRPYPTPANANPAAVRLHELIIDVRWQDAGNERVLELHTLRAERARRLSGALQ